MADREALSFRSRSEIDTFLQTSQFNQQASPFVYQGWSRINPHIRTERDTPISNFGYSGNFRVEIDKDKTKIGECWLTWTRAALASSGTFQRFQDFEGLALIDSVEILHSDGMISRTTSEQMFLEFRTMDRDKQVQWATHFLHGDLPPAQRNVLSASSQTLYVKLYNPLDKDMRLFMSIQSLGSKVTFKITTRALGHITETDDTNTPTGGAITNANLRTFNYHFSAEEKNFHNLRTKGTGMNYRVIEWSPLHVQNVATGVESTTVEYELSGLTGAAIDFIFVLYNTTSEDLVAANATNERFVYQTVDSFQGHIASTRVIPPQADVWNKHQHQLAYYQDATGDNIYRYSWSENPDDPIGVWGHMGLSQLHPLKLELQHSSTAVTDTWKLRCYCRRNNWIKHQNAKLQRLVH